MLVGRPAAAPAPRGDKGTMWVAGQVHLSSEFRMWWGAPGNPARSLAGKPTDVKPLSQLLPPLLQNITTQAALGKSQQQGGQWVPVTERR